MQRLPDDELLREPAGQVAVAELAAHRGRGKETGQGADGVADRGDTEGVSKVFGSQCLVQLSVHQMDTVGVLGDIQPEAEMPPWKRAMDKRKPKEQKAKERKESIVTAYDACTTDGKVTVFDLAEYLGVTEKRSGTD